MRMSTGHCRIIAVITAFFLMATASGQATELLPPYKDELFSQQDVLQTSNDGAFDVIGYDEMRDINGRDQIPQKRARQKYVSLGIKRQQSDETLQLGAQRLDVTRVGQSVGAAFTVIFIHGRDGDRRLGANDYSFGGNFNRLKNLVAGNGGVYYSPSVRSFDSDGVTAIEGLIRYASEQSPGKPIILACASMGNQICWGVSREPDSVKRLAGMVIMSGVADPDFAKSAFYKARLPLWFAHGSKDPVYAATDQQAFFKKLLKAGYPTHFTLYETGNHGTPIRMIDWRRTLNWILAAG
ncbi:alpha/beta hydrolase [Rhizobium cauense]|uniref:alpha/beta hydrolase n=1 Tax=Rhizobium cauense TaxID=1166683 RepID=UPI001C6DFC2E|nr:alpha/beta hydrolase [Rhizobium cauense]MBW9114931.1 alpha/beta hydrolase [Rhizobium cauense]